jgi:hypothetical protein
MTLRDIEVKTLQDDEDGFLPREHIVVRKEGSPWLIEVIPYRSRNDAGWVMQVRDRLHRKLDPDVTDEFQDYFCTYCFDTELFQAGFRWLEEHKFYPSNVSIWDHLLGDGEPGVP